MTRRARSYTLSEDGKRLTCHLCGFTSYHPTDVKYRYCGNCDVYLDTLEMSVDLSIELGIVKSGPLDWLGLLRQGVDTLRALRGVGASKPSS